MCMLYEYDAVINELKGMKPRFDAGFSLSDRKYLEELHFSIFNKRITLTGCGDCYRDAYLILFNKLKKEGKMPEISNYHLRDGELLHSFGSADYYSGNLSDDVAEHFLKLDPTSISKFDHFHPDWEVRIGLKPTETPLETTENVETDNNTNESEKAPQTPRKRRSRKNNK